MNKLSIAGLTSALVLVLSGCQTAPVRFLESSAPVPPQGYTVVGSEVTGTCDQIWVLGLGGSLDVQQARAFRDALSKAKNADALVSMSIEQHALHAFPFFSRVTTSVTGTPIKFNK